MASKIPKKDLRAIIDVMRDCLAEADGNTEVALVAAEYILATMELDELSEPTIPDLVDRKLLPEVVTLRVELPTWSRHTTPVSVIDFYGSEPPEGELGWISTGSGKWVKVVSDSPSAAATDIGAYVDILSEVVGVNSAIGLLVDYLSRRVVAAIGGGIPPQIAQDAPTIPPESPP